jgi:tripartite-type tricarboxylate transporter receptor subunit TctC
MAPYFTKYIPGHPNFVVENRPGGGGLLSSNYLYNVAPKDGSEIAMVERAAAMDPLINAKEGRAKFDPRKFGWIGSPTQEVGIGVLRLPSPIKTVDDLTKHELVVSASTATSSAATYPAILNGLFGTKLKVIKGYKGSVDSLAAVERGEGEGYINSASSGVMRAQIAPWLADGRAKVFMVLGLKPDAQYSDAIMATDLAKTDEHRQIMTLMFAPQVMAYPFVAPPNPPKDRLDALRTAFDKTVTDPDFLADAHKLKLAVDPVSGAEIAALIDRLYATPQATIDRYSQLSMPN